MTPIDVNEHETDGGMVTEALPKARVRSPNYPFEFMDPPKLVEPVRPTPTYTFWKHPNDTFPMGNIVYFIYCAGRIKIGHSDGLRKRLKILAHASPLPPVVLLVVKGGHPMEQKFHIRFAADRTHGEWFTLSKTMRSFLRSRLCPVGRVSLRKAEDEFSAYCQDICLPRPEEGRR